MTDIRTPKFVLVIEDDSMIQQAIQDRFERHHPDGWELLQAFTIPEARKLIARHGNDIKIITFDYRVPGDDGGLTARLVLDLVKEGHNALLIAASSMDNGKLLNAGCADYCEKRNLPKTILREIQEFDQNGYQRVIVFQDIHLMKVLHAECQEDYPLKARVAAYRTKTVHNPIFCDGEDWIVLLWDDRVGMSVSGWNIEAQKKHCQILHHH
ncbi:hypothetical protein A2239_04395 [Candidatus Uhrbacteria bacterium RIFOXYA2_FULL_40_9]|nr:MAG: hypothetical protein UT94_C0058G0007 [Candidatus Uhrbacteria bacterium GW2011_GWF2_40_263]OGL93633.1 MAG: hypothetical protein A2239_04395 [Candidatus Uhrbacteria bacterium RIFOXYA2_FULL_40_9]OGL97322.1 MAG: hypothetical protein A2332_03615 [Candidatus Uhrbacteria bacterium RIFOXYB2_FULL_41_18]HBK34900.1 hypothetical protein [Candidatus Uhrbacteria bacterium]HCB56127.1 hypothetical protein [Candidatus Uhrbacteria bacterium]